MPPLAALTLATAAGLEAAFDAPSPEPGDGKPPAGTATRLGIAGNRFTLDGKPAFLLGISFIGHYNPRGNHFFAYSINDRIVGWLDPKPITCEMRDPGSIR